MDAFVTIRLPVLTELGREKANLDCPQPVELDGCPSDEELITRVAEGERDSLASLFRRYADVVRRVAYRVLRDASEADDLVQEVFLLIYRKCGSFDGAKGPARQWILQMTYHRAISRRRYLNSRHFYTRLDLDDPSSELAAAQLTNSRYEDSVEAVLGNGTFEKMFQTLSENQRDTLRLFFQEGYTLDEIATKLGQSRDNVRHHYFRGLEKLRKQIFGSSSRKE